MKSKANISARLLNKLPQFWFKITNFHIFIIRRVHVALEISILVKIKDFDFWPLLSTEAKFQEAGAPNCEGLEG